MCGGGGGWGDERRGGERVEGVVRVDGKECVSDGRGCVRVCGVGAAGKKRLGGSSAETAAAETAAATTMGATTVGAAAMRAATAPQERRRGRRRWR